MVIPNLQPIITRYDLLKDGEFVKTFVTVEKDWDFYCKNPINKLRVKSKKSFTGDSLPRCNSNLFLIAPRELEPFSRRFDKDPSKWKTCVYCLLRKIEEEAASAEARHRVIFGESEDFKKNDSGKIEWHLLPWQQVKEIVRVLMFGKTKYGENNWKKCKSQKRYFNALMRHIQDYRDGEILDKETGLHHLAHAGCCLLFLLYLSVTNKDSFDL